MGYTVRLTFVLVYRLRDHTRDLITWVSLTFLNTLYKFYDPLLKSLNLNPFYNVTLYSILSVSGRFPEKIKVFEFGF